MDEILLNEEDLPNHRKIVTMSHDRAFSETSKNLMILIFRLKNVDDCEVDDYVDIIRIPSEKNDAKAFHHRIPIELNQCQQIVDIIAIIQLKDLMGRIDARKIQSNQQNIPLIIVRYLENDGQLSVGIAELLPTEFDEVFAFIVTYRLQNRCIIKEEKAPIMFCIEKNQKYFIQVTNNYVIVAIFNQMKMNCVKYFTEWNHKEQCWTLVPGGCSINIELPQTIWSTMVFRRNRLVLFNLKYKQLHVIEVDLDKRQVPVSKRNKSKLYRNEVVDPKSEWKCVELRTQTVDRMVICGRVEVTDECCFILLQSIDDNYLSLWTMNDHCELEELSFDRISIDHGQNLHKLSLNVHYTLTDDPFVYAQCSHRQCLPKAHLFLFNIRFNFRIDRTRLQHFKGMESPHIAITINPVHGVTYVIDWKNETLYRYQSPSTYVQQMAPRQQDNRKPNLGISPMDALNLGHSAVIATPLTIFNRENIVNIFPMEIVPPDMLDIKMFIVRKIDANRLTVEYDVTDERYESRQLYLYVGGRRGEEILLNSDDRYVSMLCNANTGKYSNDSIETLYLCVFHADQSFDVHVFIVTSNPDDDILCFQSLFLKRIHIAHISSIPSQLFNWTHLSVVNDYDLANVDSNRDKLAKFILYFFDLHENKSCFASLEIDANRENINEWHIDSFETSIERPVVTNKMEPMTILFDNNQLYAWLCIWSQCEEPKIWKFDFTTKIWTQYHLLFTKGMHFPLTSVQFSVLKGFLDQPNAFINTHCNYFNCIDKSHFYRFTLAHIDRISSKLPIIDKSQFKKGKKIGNGSFGSVSLCEYETGKFWALKELTNASKEQQRTAINEARRLETVSHENIVKCVGIGSDCIFMEFMDNGTLQKEIDTFNYNTNNIINWCAQLTSAVDYLHHSGLVHCDLKPNNILLSNNRKTLKLSDFGLTATQKNEMLKGQGTPGYVAPEVYASHQYNDKADVYSFGVILWQLITGDKPINTSANSSLFVMVHMPKLVIANSYIDGQPNIDLIPDDREEYRLLKLIVNSCWKYNPNDRPTTRFLWQYFYALQKCIELQEEYYNSSEESSSAYRKHFVNLCSLDEVDDYNIECNYVDQTISELQKMLSNS